LIDATERKKMSAAGRRTQQGNRVNLQADPAPRKKLQGKPAGEPLKKNDHGIGTIPFPIQGAINTRLFSREGTKEKGG